jgi:hypothetical protein
VVSTDTLVENPVVAMWVGLSLDRMAKAAAEQDLPIKPNRLMPRVEDSFWVNLIGKGYPAPRHKFRWCTERLKIRPSNAFIMSVVKQSREAILLLGARKQESNARAKVLARNEWRGTYVPVVACIGDEIMIDGKRVYQGLIRHARDTGGAWFCTHAELAAWVSGRA